jgi:exonuclease 3'-5' domain-containing protein 1
MPECIFVTKLDADTVQALVTLLASKTLALDVEGIDLGRFGAVSLVQLATRTRTFVFDVLGRAHDDPLVQFLRARLEDANTVKVVHDCRMDSDALQHCLEIELRNVHDTACWHAALTGEREVGLHALHQHHGLPADPTHRTNVYAQNHAFWRARPLTDAMLERAANDVAQLLCIYDAQRARAGAEQAAAAGAQSAAAVAWARAAQACWVVVCRPREFVGRSGSTVKALRARTKTLLYHRGDRAQNNWVVYYDTENQIAHVRAAAAR